jgi:hypothetical protein
MRKFTFTLAIVFLGSCALFSQANSSLRDTLFVKITDPSSDGFRVDREYDVTGTAQIPSGQYLWVLCHRKGLPQWWPQNSATIDPITNKWLVTVNFGEAKDIGKDFEIIVIAVDQQEHARLNNKIGLPIQLPNSKYSYTRVVRKVSHD